MNDQQNSIRALIVAILLSAAIAGGTVYYWTKNQQPVTPQQPQATTTPSVQTPIATTTNAAKTPVVIYTEEIKQTMDEKQSRSFSTVRIMEKVGNDVPVLLADNIGKVGEYAHDFKLSPDKKTLYISLESKMQKLDLATKTLTDFFTPKKQVQSYLISKDGKRMYIWDQIYASTTDAGYYLHLLDLTTNTDKILKQGTLADGTYLFISSEREDGILTLVKAMGEGSVPWSFNPKTGELRSVPEIPSTLLHEISSTGKYIASNTEDVAAICNDIFGGISSIFVINDSYTGKKIDTFGIKNMATDILGYSPGDTEILFSSYAALSKPTPENKGSTKDCENYKPTKTYYRMSIGTGKPVAVANYQEVLNQWNPSSTNFDSKYVSISDQQVQYVITYKGNEIFRPATKQQVVEYFEQ